MTDPTSIAWGVLLSLAAIYEGIALFAGWHTLSQVVWAASKRWPAVPFGAGLLMGHFFL